MRKQHILHLAWTAKFLYDGLPRVAACRIKSLLWRKWIYSSKDLLPTQSQLFQRLSFHIQCISVKLSLLKMNDIQQNMKSRQVIVFSKPLPIMCERAWNTFFFIFLSLIFNSYTHHKGERGRTINRFVIA